VLPHALHQPENREEQRHAEREGDERLLGEVGEEQPERHAVEAEALLDHERAVERERQRDHRLEEEHAEEQRRAVGERPRRERRCPGVGQGLQQAAQRQREDQGRVDQHVRPAEASLRRRVVGRLLVRGERDRLGEGPRDAVAVRAYVPDLALREPQASRARQGDGSEEEPGQEVHVRKLE
jgi:hypothetical protein